MVLSKMREIILKNDRVPLFLEDIYGRLSYFLLRGKAFSPLCVTLLVSYECNCRCKMCFYYHKGEGNNTLRKIIQRKPEELSLEEIKLLIDDLCQMGTRFLTLHGGEPLIRSDLLDIARYAIERGLVVRLTTNGTLISESKAQMIIEAGIEHISFSLDGSEAVHDNIRNTGTFNKLVTAVRLINYFKDKTRKELPDISFGCYISSLNERSFDEVLDVANQFQIKDVSFNLATHNTKDAANLTKEILGISSEVAESAIGSLEIDKTITSVNIATILGGRKKVQEKTRLYRMNVIFPTVESIKLYHYPYYNQKNRCLFPWTRSVISPYGEVYPCIDFSFINATMGTIKRQKFSEIWNGEKYRNFRRTLKRYKLLPLCSKCCSVNGGEKI